MITITYALLVMIAVFAADHSVAEGRHRIAQRHSRTTARRERQLAEIAALVMKGEWERANGLSFEHASEFPDDADLLTSLLDSLPSAHANRVALGAPDCPIDQAARI